MAENLILGYRLKSTARTIDDDHISNRVFGTFEYSRLVFHTSILSRVEFRPATLDALSEAAAMAQILSWWVAPVPLVALTTTPPRLWACHRPGEV